MFSWDDGRMADVIASWIGNYSWKALALRAIWLAEFSYL